MGIAQTWEYSFGNLLEMQKNLFQTVGEKKNQQNDLLSCWTVQSDLTVKSKGAISVT